MFKGIFCWELGVLFFVSPYSVKIYTFSECLFKVNTLFSTPNTKTKLLMLWCMLWYIVSQPKLMLWKNSCISRRTNFPFEMKGIFRLQPRSGQKAWNSCLWDDPQKVKPSLHTALHSLLFSLYCSLKISLVLSHKQYRPYVLNLAFGLEVISACRRGSPTDKIFHSLKVNFSKHALFVLAISLTAHSLHPEPAKSKQLVSSLN